MLSESGSSSSSSESSSSSSKKKKKNKKKKCKKKKKKSTSKPTKAPTMSPTASPTVAPAMDVDFAVCQVDTYCDGPDDGSEATAASTPQACANECKASGFAYFEFDGSECICFQGCIDAEFENGTSLYRIESNPCSELAACC